MLCVCWCCCSGLLPMHALENAAHVRQLELLIALIFSANVVSRAFAATHHFSKFERRVRAWSGRKRLASSNQNTAFFFARQNTPHTYIKTLSLSQQPCSSLRTLFLQFLHMVMPQWFCCKTSFVDTPEAANTVASTSELRHDSAIRGRILVTDGGPGENSKKQASSHRTCKHS